MFLRHGHSQQISFSVANVNDAEQGIAIIQETIRTFRESIVGRLGKQFS
jgi:hypothetical protein